MKSGDSLKRDVESNVMLKRVKIPERRVAIKWFHSWLLPRDFSQYACPWSSPHSQSTVFSGLWVRERIFLAFIGHCWTYI